MATTTSEMMDSYTASIRKLVEDNAQLEAENERLRDSRARLVALLYAVDEVLPSGLPHYSNLVDRVGLLESRSRYLRDA
jgi:hypothetical protein